MSLHEVLTYEFATFLKVDTDFERMGEGIESLGLSYNPEVKERGYVHEKTKRKTTTGYAPSFSLSQIAVVGDPVFDYLDGLRKKMAVGTELKTEIMLVYIYSAKGSGYEASKHTCSISINEFSGDAQDNMSISYDVSVEGDMELGTATIADGVATFVKDIPTP